MVLCAYTSFYDRVEMKYVEERWWSEIWVGVTGGVGDVLNVLRRLSWLRSERWVQLIGVVPRHSPFISFVVFANLKVFAGDGTGPSGTDVD